MKRPDILDQAQELQAMEIENSLKNMPRYTSPEATGNCLYCGEEVEPPKKFCDSECAKKWSAKYER